MAKNSMEITIQKISAGGTTSQGLIYWKLMMLLTLFLSIDSLLHIVYTFRSVWGNNLSHLLAFCFELIIFERDHIYLPQYIQHLSLGIVVILLAVCLVTLITTESFSMRIQQSLFKHKWKFTPSRTTLAINFSAVQSTTPVYTTNRLRSSHIISVAHGSWPFYRRILGFPLISSSSSFWSKSKIKQQWDIWW